MTFLEALVQFLAGKRAFGFVRWDTPSHRTESRDGEDYLAHQQPARGWSFRVGRRWGLKYQNISVGGFHPLFGERYGKDRTLAVRFGRHLFTVLRPIKPPISDGAVL
jgi:hypothetical protein